MATIKMVVSLQELLYEQVGELAREMKAPQVQQLSRQVRQLVEGEG